MKVALLPVSRAALVAGVVLMLTQCAMPPRDAWRIVQNDGLIPYVMGTYDYQAGPEQNRYLASAAPLQHSPVVSAGPTIDELPRVTYRPSASSNSSSGTVPNRYLAGSYYEAEKSAPSRPKPAPKRESADTEDSAPSLARSTPEPKRSTPSAPPIDKPSSTPPKLEPEDLPYGTPVSGRPGMVNSPFATRDQLVDVTGMSVGETVKCPYSGKLFRVPPGQQASTPKASSSTPDLPDEPKSPEPAPEPELKPEGDKPAADTPAADTDKPKA